MNKELDDIEDSWAEYPQKVFEEIKRDAFEKGFWCGILLSLVVGLFFLIGITFGKGGQP